MSSVPSKYMNKSNNNNFSKNLEISKTSKLDQPKTKIINNKLGNNSNKNSKTSNNNNQYLSHNYSRDQSLDIKISDNINRETNSNQINNNKFRNSNNTNLPKENNPLGYFNKKDNKTQNIKNGLKNSPVFIEIEYEKINNKKTIQNDENGNFNVYFMKPDLKAKTISATKKQTFRINSKYRQNMIQNQNRSENMAEIINDDEEENPYNDNNYNFSNKEQQFQKKNVEIMPLEIIHHNYERQFKSHLVQKLISFKLKQTEKGKIPLNIASKKRREESIQNSLKYLLEKQSQPIDFKKELMYYKGYFRFWRRKCKSSLDKQRYKKRFKKDRNIRITTVIYKAEKPKEKKRTLTKSIEFRKNLIIILENRKKYVNDNFTDLIKNIDNKENINKNELNLNKILYDKKEECINFEEAKTNNSKSIEEKIKQKDYSKNINDNNIINNKEIKVLDNLNNINDKIEKNENVNYKIKIDNKNKKFEAINRIIIIIEKEIASEGFKQFKNYFNKNRKKNGLKILENILEKKYYHLKIEIIHELKINQNKSKILEALNTLNKLIINKKNSQIKNGYKKLMRFYYFIKSQNNNQDNYELNNKQIMDVIENNINSKNINNEKNNINVNNSNNFSQQIQSENEIDNICDEILNQKNKNEQIIIDLNKEKKENDLINNKGNNEKWTINKFNWKLGDSIKENDSLFGLSEDELKNSRKIKNNLNLNEQINGSEKIKINTNSIDNNLLAQKQENIDKFKNIKSSEEENNIITNENKENEEEEVFVNMNHYLNQNNKINERNSQIRYAENEEENEQPEEEEFIYEEGEENEIDIKNANPKKILQTTEEEEGDGNDEQVYQKQNSENQIKNEQGVDYNEEEMNNNNKNGGENEFNGEEEYNYEEVEGGEIYLDGQNPQESEEIEQEEGEADEEEGEEAYYVVQRDNGEEGEEFYIDNDNEGEEFNEEIEVDENGEEQGFIYVNDEEFQEENLNYEEDNENNNN